MQHVAADLRIEQDRHDVEKRAGQRIGGGDGAEGVGEKQQRRAEHARPQDRQDDETPVLEAVGPEDVRRLAPLAS